MAATEAAARIASPRFADHRRLDRNFFLPLVALLWLGILMGFVPAIVHRVRIQKPFQGSDPFRVNNSSARVRPRFTAATG